MVGLVINDDEALALLQPSNTSSVSAAVRLEGWFRQDTRFEYSHAAKLAREWTERCDQLARLLPRAGWRAGLTDERSEACLGLYNQALERSHLLTTLAWSMANRTAALTSDILQQLWGPPPTDLEYKAAVQQLHDRATKEADNTSETVQRLATDLLAQLPTFQTVAQYRDQPRAETVARFAGWVAEHLGFIRDYVEGQGFDPKVKLGSMSIAAAYREVLASAGYASVDVLVGDYSSIMYKPSERRVCIPAGRQMTPGILIKNMGHELIHIVRAINGAQGLLDLGGLGTGAHLPFEEGLVASAEVLFQPNLEKLTISYGKPDATVAIGLAFREGYDAVYKVMRLWHALKAAALAAKKGEVDYRQTMADAHDKAMTRLVRSCRGLSGGFRFANPRDLCYARGAEDFWRFMEQASEKDVARLLSAKVDLTDLVQYTYAML
jgi:hypothetical protein